MKPTTLEEALSLVPTHWPLTPGVDVWQEGDEWYIYDGHSIKAHWVKNTSNNNYRNPYSRGLTYDIPLRRPIPQDVRESIAEMILHAARAESKDSAWAEDILGRWILAGKP